MTITPKVRQELTQFARNVYGASAVRMTIIVYEDDGNEINDYYVLGRYNAQVFVELRQFATDSPWFKRHEVVGRESRHERYRWPGFDEYMDANALVEQYENSLTKLERENKDRAFMAVTFDLDSTAPPSITHLDAYPGIS